MRNYIKLSLALLVFISLMSFSNSSISEVKSKSNITIADTLTWKMLGDIKYVRKNTQRMVK